MSVLITTINLKLVCGLLCWAARAIPVLPEPIPAVVTVLIVLFSAVWLNIGALEATPWDR